MSFDTTSVNTGRFRGVCVLLENLVGRELLWLACRHHVLKLMLAKVFTMCCGPSSSPEIRSSSDLRHLWGGIIHQNFRGLEFLPGTESFRKASLEFLTEIVSTKSQVRDDYQELIELTLIVLGKPPENVHWRAPGPIHRARWMAKLLYAIKIFLFRDQREAFNLTKKEAQLQRFVQSGALLHTTAWTTAPRAADAPVGDLKLWMDLIRYLSFDHEISVAAQKVLREPSVVSFR